jgi:hypothetical protein
MSDVADIRMVRVLVFIFLTIGTASQAYTQSREPYQILAAKNVAVSMRDGTRLMTDIYRPSVNGIALPGKFPTLLVRTPYDRSGDEDYASAFVPHGYALVVQSVRGRYGSGGRWSLFRNDSGDGYDTAAWITSQEWSDGGIGTLGGSYEGGTQYAMAVANPPALKAMVPFVAATNPGLYGIRHHGAFELRFFTWLLVSVIPLIVLLTIPTTPETIPQRKLLQSQPKTIANMWYRFPSGQGQLRSEWRQTMNPPWWILCLTETTTIFGKILVSML